MQEYTITRYSFDELGETAREKAITQTQESLWEWLDSDLVKEFLTDYYLQELGNSAKELEVEFSLSHCQGDGVALYGRLHKSEALAWPEGVAYLELTKNSWGAHYSHYNSFYVTAYDEEGYELGLDISVVEKQLRDLCRELERMGYQYIQNETGRESAIHYLESETGNDFTIDGDCDPITITDTSELVGA